MSTVAEDRRFLRICMGYCVAGSLIKRARSPHRFDRGKKALKPAIFPTSA